MLFCHVYDELFVLIPYCNDAIPLNASVCLFVTVIPFVVDVAPGAVVVGDTVSTLK